MKTRLYKLFSVIVILSLVLNAAPPTAAAAQAPQPVRIAAESVDDTQTVGAGSSVAPVRTPPPPTPTPQPVKVQIPATGGTIRSLDGKFVINFSSAYGKAFAAVLQTLTAVGSGPRNMRRVGTAYTLGATLPNDVVIASFAPNPPPEKDSEANSANNFTITVKYTDADVRDLDESTLGIYVREPKTGAWRRLPSLLNTAANSLTAQADQTGDFAIFAEKAQLNASANNLKLVLDPDDNVGWAVWPGVGRVEELTYGAKLAREVRAKFQADSCTVDVLLTRETDNPKYLSTSTRAQEATNFNADMFVTFAFNALNGSPWGWAGDGGVEAWARSGHADDDALVNQFFNFIQQMGRPHNKPIEHPSRYAAFNALPSTMTYAHIETLYLDHNYDWPIIHGFFDKVTNAAYSAIRTRLEAQGMTCGRQLPPPPTAAELQRMRDLGYQNYQRYGADPVSFSTGNHVIERKLFSLPGHAASAFDFNLIYNSQDKRDGYFGIGWSAPLAYVQLYNDDSVTVTLPDGRAYYLPSSGNDRYNVPQDLHATLVRTGDGWTWTEANGTNMTFVEALRGFGPVTEIRDRHGNTYKYEYNFDSQDPGNARPNLTKISDNSGQVMNFQSDADGHVTSISIPGGRTFGFDYTDGDLTEITDPKDNAYRYEYDNRDRITKEWDPEGFLFLQNEYDDQDRVVKQTDASGSTLTLSYQSGSTSYTDNLGNVTQYFFDSQNRITSIKDALGNTTSFEYDNEDNLTRKVDERGKSFSYTYDSDGNLLSASGPEGYAVSYTYNSFGDLTSVTDHGGPNGAARTTTFTVNAQGDITTIQYPGGSGVQMTYDTRGNLKTLKDENGATTSYTYDGQGKLTEITDPLGNKTSFTYDAARRKTSMTDANGNVVKFEYDANGNITRIIDPKVNDTTFTYDKNDNLVKMIDRRNAAWLFSYDENLKLASETDPSGHVTRYGYDAMYNLASKIDPEGNVTRYTYNKRYELIQVRDAKGGLTRFAYDPAGNLTQVTDALNNVTRFEYNDLNLPTAQVDALNGRSTSAYDVVGRLREQTNPRGAKTSYTYDARDRVVEIRDALNGVWKTAYDPAGNPVQYTDAKGRVTAMQYDAAGRPLSYTDAAGNQTRFELDGVGNLKRVTDALGRITNYAYDENDNIASIIDALGQTTAFAYDAEDNLKLVKDARGNFTSFAYNLDGLLAKMVEAGGQASLFAYDGNHNLIKFTNAKGNVWSFAYDAVNQRISQTDPLNRTTQYSYDLLGRQVGVTDAKGTITQYQYDALDRLTAVIQNASSAPADPQTNVTTRYTYDDVGNLLSIIDANGNPDAFTYDLLDRLTGERNAEDHTWNYVYDAVGNLTQRTDANGDTTRYSYTLNDLLAQVDYPDHSNVIYTYDAVGNQLTAAKSRVGTITNTYDVLNRLTSSTDSAHRTVRYAYDEVGNPKAITYPDGKILRYSYDATNYLASVIDPQGNVTKITRDATHNATLIENPNKTLAKYEFDVAEQLKSVTNQRINGALINSFAYSLDKVGNRTQTVATYPFPIGKNDAGAEHGRKTFTLTTQYGYDPLNRLVRSSESTGRQSTYSYDAVGNRTRLVTNANPMSGDAAALDAEHGKKPDLITLNYAYDKTNALTSVTQGDGARDLSKVSAALKDFIKEVDDRSGKSIDAQTASALDQTVNDIMAQIANGADRQTLETAINALSQQVQAARKAKKIKSEGLARELLEKLKKAGDANRESRPHITNETDYKYDRNGNRIEQVISGGDHHDDVDAQHGNHSARLTYQYDFENRLVNARGSLARNDLSDEHNGGNPAIDTSMTYDAYGRLFERRIRPGSGHASDVEVEHDGRKAIQFVYDGLDPIAEYSGSNSHNGLDAEHGNSSKHTNYYRGDGRILSSLSNAEAGYAPGRMSYYHYDGLNSVTALTKQNGQSQHDYRYSDFGAALDRNGHPQDASNFTDPHNHYTYTGQEWDESTSLYHFYAREYDASTGTWLQQDPYRGQISSPMSLYRYGYVGDNPINWTDSHGYYYNTPCLDQKKSCSEQEVEMEVKNAAKDQATNLVDLSESLEALYKEGKISPANYASIALVLAKQIDDGRYKEQIDTLDALSTAKDLASVIAGGNPYSLLIKTIIKCPNGNQPDGQPCGVDEGKTISKLMNKSVEYFPTVMAVTDSISFYLIDRPLSYIGVPPYPSLVTPEREKQSQATMQKVWDSTAQVVNNSWNWITQQASNAWNWAWNSL